jgi:hypothetical protein
MANGLTSAAAATTESLIEGSANTLSGIHPGKILCKSIVQLLSYG